ncbi:hypothetical protein [Neorhizobium petrolearium]|uniref:hypothetical protein n=1 Tax=Neorhizobium petrolearium TaxID=515361 RepID=UPI003F13CFA3
MNDILRISLPLTVWLASFSAVYGLQGLSCSQRWMMVLPPRGTLLVAWAMVVAMQVILLLLLRIRRFASPSPFVQRLSVSLAVVALLASIWTLFPVVATSRCVD